MKKILVTGGAGFIGAHLVQKLIDKKFKVMVVDNLKTIGGIPYVNPKSYFLKGDILDEKILKKIEMGVDFFQTQYVFDEFILKEYMKVLEDAGILEKTFFIIGLGPFASAKSAKWMNDNLFGVDIPDEIIKRLEQSKDQKEESKKICLELINIYRGIKGVHGVHLMGHNKERVIAEIIKKSKKN